MTFSANPKISVIGLGYVGLPLAVEFASHFDVIGYDLSATRIEELERGVDSTKEVPSEMLKASKLKYSNAIEDIKACNIYIVAVPTPVDEHNQPNLTPLLNVSRDLGKLLTKNDIVIYESTVYPGTTEEQCVPVLESSSGLKFNQDFFVGYSPERANPGDTKHQLKSIVKVVSGSTPEVATYIQELYNNVVACGTHKTSSIKVAEAAKIIENTQRDINIALMNELAIIFNKLNIDSKEVIEAASTKWNFNKYFPGLVGGHCIGVDPYYLTYKAQEVGYHPEIILAGRRLNDSMGHYVAERTVKLMVQHGVNVVNAKVLIVGLTFKENCPDLRNTKVVDIVSALKEYNVYIDVYDPIASPELAMEYYDIELNSKMEEGIYDAVVIAVPHQEIIKMGISKIKKSLKQNGVVFDVKSVFPIDESDERL